MVAIDEGDVQSYDTPTIGAATVIHPVTQINQMKSSTCSGVLWLLALDAWDVPCPLPLLLPCVDPCTNTSPPPPPRHEPPADPPPPALPST